MSLLDRLLGRTPRPSPIGPREVLLVLLSEGQSYGLALHEAMSVRTCGHITLPLHEVYPLLRDLERQGLLESFEADPTPERGGRPRRYYSITDAGREALAWTRSFLRQTFSL